MTRREVNQIIQEIGTEALSAFRYSIACFCSVRNTGMPSDFLRLLDADLVDGNGFPTTKGRDLEAYLAS